ncbi:response regulator transcription factor [Modestobacter sp. I12A-02662]|uniref:response regulator transcription factor n=1 Tax=Modestobacter sp. I12A-02662 TaxID=1730496 RepID=UPI0034DFC689
MRVLVVEDQPKMRDVLCRGLGEAGYDVDTAADGPTALQLTREAIYDALVLDVMLPGFDGLELLRRLRADDVWTPVLMLTARDTVSDRVSGLDAGADDYLVKPFAFTELVSRVRALIRRGSTSHQVVLRCGPLELDPTTRRVALSGTPVELSPREFAVLDLLLRRQGHVVPRAEILEHVWGVSSQEGSNVVDVYVKYLRDKIDRRFGTRLIHTVRGAGYRLTEPS